MIESLKKRLSALAGWDRKGPKPMGQNESYVDKIVSMLGTVIRPSPEQTRWSIGDWEVARALASTGDLGQAARLWNGSMADGVISGAVSARVNGMVSLPKKFLGDAQVVNAISAADENGISVYDMVFPFHELVALQRSALGIGVGYAQLIDVPGRDFPVMRTMPSDGLRYNFSSNCWYYHTVAGLVPLTPGDGKTILHLIGTHYRPWDNSLFVPVGRAFILRDHSTTLMANWQVKLAHPARVAEAPLGASDPQVYSWFQQVASWAINPVFATRPGYSVKVVEINGRGYESFIQAAEAAKTDALYAINGQDGSSGARSMFGDASIFERIRKDLIFSDATALGYTISTQGIPRVVADMFGEDALDRCISVKYNIVTSTELAAKADATMKFSASNNQEGVSLDQGGIDDLDIPLKVDDEDTSN